MASRRHARVMRSLSRRYLGVRIAVQRKFQSRAVNAWCRQVEKIMNSPTIQSEIHERAIERLLFNLSNPPVLASAEALAGVHRMADMVLGRD